MEIKKKNFKIVFEESENIKFLGLLSNERCFKIN